MHRPDAELLFGGEEVKVKGRVWGKHAYRSYVAALWKSV